MQQRWLCAVVALAVLAPCAHAFYSAGGPVVELTASNLQSKIKSTGGVWLVEFYAPWCGHCQQLKPAWEQAAKALKGVVSVGAADVDTHKELGGEYNIKGFPTIKLMWADDSGKIKSQDFNGGRTAKDIVSFGLEKAKALVMKRLESKDSSSGSSGSGGGSGSKKASGGGGGGGASGGGGSDGGFYQGTDVTVLTDDNFNEFVASSDEPWLVEFYAPWCGHCKNLKPAWQRAAKELKGSTRIGAIDCTAHQSTCTTFGVRGYPTIKFFGSDKKRPEDYQGGRDVDSIVAFGRAKFEQVGPKKPPPEPVELTSADTFELNCVGDGDEVKAQQLCIIAFLPNILDSKAVGRKKEIDILRAMAAKYRDRPFSYLWVEGAAQTALENNFGIGGFGYPALVAYYPKENKYAVSKTAYEPHHVEAFVESLRQGGERLLPISGAVATLATLQPWDGKDAKEEVVEEFDLSELMDEDEKTEL